MSNMPSDIPNDVLKILSEASKTIKDNELMVTTDKKKVFGIIKCPICKERNAFEIRMAESNTRGSNCSHCHWFIPLDFKYIAEKLKVKIIIGRINNV